MSDERKMKPKKCLVAFDFDNTIVDTNTDVCILDLLDNKILPPEVAKVSESDGWTKYMGAIFQHIRSSQISTEALRSHIQKVTFVPGMDLVMDYLRNNAEHFEALVISDANSLFISWFLSSSGYADVFSASNIHTNPAVVDEDDTIRISYYHHNTTCNLSSPNMCKGAILQEHVEKHSSSNHPFQHTVYIGDGSNDYCPCKTLGVSDYALARENHKLLAKIRQKPEEIQATIVPWKHGQEILQVLTDIKAKME